jgi:hypothetical protein
MNAYSLAAELLGDIELSAGQLSQLRALDYRYQLEVQRLLSLREDQPAAAPESSGARSGPGPEDAARLRLMVTAGIRELLTPGQRALLDNR